MGRSLRKVGIRAYAEVLSAEQTSISVTTGNPNLLSNIGIRATVRRFGARGGLRRILGEI